jgi:DUF218 domain-containing protein
MRLLLVAILCGCGAGISAPPSAGFPDAGTAAAAACEVPPMDQLYSGAWPPNPWAPALIAAPCMTQRHDAIIVLGCPSNADGSASDCQRSRAQMAASLYAQGFAANLIATGAAAHNAWVEADALTALLTARGVPGAAIVREPLAMHTDENLYYSSRIMQQRGWISALVVSDDPGHLVFTAVCDSNCCVKLGRLTVVELPDQTRVGHYVLYPQAEQVGPAECAQIRAPEKFMCTNLLDRKACADFFQLRPMGTRPR